MKIVKHLGWLGGIGLTVMGYVLAEGWLILVVKLFGFWGGAAIVMLVTLLLSWLVIYFSSGARNIGRFRNWLKEKEAELSGKAKAAVGGGKILAVANTAVLLGPMVAALLMLIFGIRRNKVYFYSIFCALLCAVFWSGFYSGIFWGIHKVITK
ncbi:MAG: hypothetical protein PHN63_01275 [Candidatus Omnitrophica bacterium]|nr:hypothetical protein [Candidatus Omnitrophota bacterium]